MNLINPSLNCLPLHPVCAAFVGCDGFQPQTFGIPSLVSHARKAVVQPLSQASRSIGLKCHLRQECYDFIKRTAAVALRYSLASDVLYSQPYVSSKKSSRPTTAPARAASLVWCVISGKIETSLLFIVTILLCAQRWRKRQTSIAHHLALAPHSSKPQSKPKKKAQRRSDEQASTRSKTCSAGW